jgi:hypothetical protein
MGVPGTCPIAGTAVASAPVPGVELPGRSVLAGSDKPVQPVGSLHQRLDLAAQVGIPAAGSSGKAARSAGFTFAAAARPWTRCGLYRAA